ncbi:hypothetical protein [uncultured Mailhella sp.]|uniref:hypothetical protein n=1 Tax=uncultured Mailhella sp. TaxID=1981031 RepID=UPI0025FCAB5B|nr:hypothetical protein [uncultured Mailhella sp.]
MVAPKRCSLQKKESAAAPSAPARIPAAKTEVKKRKERGEGKNAGEERENFEKFSLSSPAPPSLLSKLFNFYGEGTGG